jgi:hypothetical protein
MSTSNIEAKSSGAFVRTLMSGTSWLCLLLLWGYYCQRRAGKTMAISPKAVLDSFRELTPAERGAVDQLEQEIDAFLLRNYYPEGSCTYAPLRDYSIDQLREACRRYREAGWKAVVLGTVDMPVFYFFRRDGDSDQSISHLKTIG